MSDDSDEDRMTMEKMGDVDGMSIVIFSFCIMSHGHDHMNKDILTNSFTLPCHTLPFTYLVQWGETYLLLASRFYEVI